MMMDDWHTLAAWFQAVLSGMAEPWLIAVVLALTTLLLEDLAIAAGVALATQGAISWGLSMTAVGGGIAIGDIGLYGVGFAAIRVPWFRHKLTGDRSLWIRDQLINRLASAVLLARVIPGLRFVTYTACGFVKVPLLPFIFWVLLATCFWVVGLYGLSVAIGSKLAEHLGIAPAIAVAIPIAIFALSVPLVRKLYQRFQGKKS